MCSQAHPSERMARSFWRQEQQSVYALKSDERCAGQDAGRGKLFIPAIGSDGTIYVSDSVAMYALDSNGSRRWEFDRAPWRAGHCRSADVCDGDSVYGFDLGTSGAAASPWPMRMHPRKMIAGLWRSISATVLTRGH